MRVEFQNGRFILCGVILPKEKIEVGQTWAAGNSIVQVDEVDQFGWVRYHWFENDELRSNEKESFSFQSRYCLVLPSSQIPKELL